MKQFFQKKQWMMVSLVAALGVAVYLNYYFTQEPALGATDTSTPVSDGDVTDTPGDVVQVGATVSGVDQPEEDTSAESPAGSGEDYFDAARTSRTEAREESVRLLDEVLGSATAGEQEKKTATEQAAAIAANILQESNVENLILAKGFPDCVVFISGETCQVVVDADELQAQESAQILEIVQLQTGVPAKNVKISTPKD